MELYEWIDHRLTSRGRNAVVDLARALNINKSAVSRIRKGEREVKARELEIIEDFFGERSPTRSGIDDREETPERERDDWVLRNLYDHNRKDPQQVALNYLVFYASKIAERLDRIMSHLERRDRPEQPRSSGADTRLGSRISRRKG